MIFSILPRRRFFLFIFGFSLLRNVCHASTMENQDDATRISLASFDLADNDGRAFYAEINLAPQQKTFVELYDVPNFASYAVVQIHTQESNVTLSYVDEQNCLRSNCSVCGSDVGLWIPLNGVVAAKVAATNEGNRSVEALVAAVAYTDKAPISGGCNMEFDMEVSPFEKLYFTDSTVILEAQPASAPKNSMIPCEMNSVKLTIYRMYMPERDYNSATYFDGIKKMMTVDDITKNGQKILSAVGAASTVRRIFSAYPGTGSVYAMIATYGNYSSAYVPAATYACNPLSNPSSCGDLNTTISRIICAIVLIVGFILTFVGHKCLGFEVAFLGAISGGIITFAIFTSFGYFETSTILGIAMAAGVLSGISWIVLASCMDHPSIATLLSSLTLGFFVASTVYFGIADDTPLFESDVNFWLIYTGVTLLVPIVLAALPFSSNLVCCSILGAYSIILPIDYYAGSNLKYIVVNTLRRATVPGFNLAVIQPPYQSTDKCLVAFLIIIALIGICVQVREAFCCSCRKNHRSTTVFWNERRPILSEARSGRRILVFGENERVVHSNW